jgi:Zn-dependent protease with chaperone function
MFGWLGTVAVLGALGGMLTLTRLTMRRAREVAADAAAVRAGADPRLLADGLLRIHDLDPDDPMRSQRAASWRSVGVRGRVNDVLKAAAELNKDTPQGSPAP